MLHERIDQEMKIALKERNSDKVSVLRMIKAAIKNKLIEKRLDSASDELVMDVIQKQVKQHEDSIEQFQKARRTDLVDKETQELQILKTYLPEPMSESDLKELIAIKIKEVGAQSKKDTGRVMKLVMEATKGRADGKKINKIVGESLPS